MKSIEVILYLLYVRDQVVGYLRLVPSTLPVQDSVSLLGHHTVAGSNLSTLTDAELQLFSVWKGLTCCITKINNNKGTCCIVLTCCSTFAILLCCSNCTLQFRIKDTCCTVLIITCCSTFALYFICCSTVALYIHIAVLLHYTYMLQY